MSSWSSRRQAHADRARTTNFGFLAVRIAQSMTVFDGGGAILNSGGDRNEREAHEKQADWIDQSGPVSEDRWGGIAIFDHLDNPRTRPTGTAVTTAGRAAFNLKGGYQIEPDKPLRLNYRLCLHRHDARRGNVAQAICRIRVETGDPHYSASPQTVGPEGGTHETGGQEPKPVRVRRADPRDMEALLTIEQQCFNVYYYDYYMLDGRTSNFTSRTRTASSWRRPGGPRGIATSSGRSISGGTRRPHTSIASPYCWRRKRRGSESAAPILHGSGPLPGLPAHDARSVYRQ